MCCCTVLASVLLHCAAHCTIQPDREDDVFISVCELAAKFAAAAWAVPSSNLQKASEGLPSEQQQAILAEAEQLAAAEGGQVVFLQHIMAIMLGTLRKHCPTVEATGSKPVACAAVDNPGSSSNSSRRDGGSVRNNGSTGDGGSAISDSSSSSMPAGTAPTALAVSQAVSAWIAVIQHCSSRLDLQSRLAAAAPSRGQGNSAVADGSAVAVHIFLTATLQECVRLGATYEQFQPQWDAITQYLTSCSVNMLAQPGSSQQQQQLFGLLCSLHKTVQLQAGSNLQSRQSAAGDFQSAALRLKAIARIVAAAVSQAGSSMSARQLAAATAAAVESGQPRMRLGPSDAAASAAAVLQVSISSPDSSGDALLMVDNFSSFDSFSSLSVGLAISVISVNGWHELFELHSYRCNID